MLKLYGFPSSNYVNMVQFALMEKEIPFEFVYTLPDQSPELLTKSPRGKLPALETPDGFLSEASVIMEYLEDLGQGKSLLPTELYARARVRALMKEIEIYIELPVRACYAEALYGATVPEAIKEKSKSELIAGFAALKRHASFSPYIAGAEFTLADIVFYFGAKIASSVAQRLFGLDLLAEIPGANSLLAMLGENPNVQKLVAARVADMPAFIAKMKAMESLK